MNIEQVSTKTASEVDSVPKIFCCLFEHNVVEYSEERQRQDAILLHIVDNREGFREVTVLSAFVMLVFVQLDDYV